MLIPTYTIYALVFVVGLILFRQVFVAWRNDQERKTQPTLFGEKKKEPPQLLDEKMDTRKRMIVDQAHERGEITNNEVEKMFGVSHTTAWRYLDDLEEEGRLVQVGKTGRGVIYTSTPGAF